MANLDIFRNDPSVRSFGAGEAIFEAGEPGEAMFVILDGEVELRLADGRLLATIASGEVFGEMALVDRKPRSASARAKTDVQAAPIDARRFTYLVQNTPFFALEVMRTMADRLRAMDDALPR